MENLYDRIAGTVASQSGPAALVKPGTRVHDLVDLHQRQHDLLLDLLEHRFGHQGCIGDGVRCRESGFYDPPPAGQ